MVLLQLKITVGLRLKHFFAIPWWYEFDETNWISLDEHAVMVW